MRAIVLISLIALCAALLPQLAQGQDVLSPEEALRQLDESMQRARLAYESIDRYTAVVEVRERHGGEARRVERIFVVYQKQPQRMYCRWLEGGEFAGLQASYSAERDPDHFLALETGLRGLAGVLRFKLDSALGRSLYPHHFNMVQYDFGTQLDNAYQLYTRARELNKYRIEVQGISQHVVPGRRVKLYQLLVTDDPGDGLFCKRLTLGFDQDNGMPLYMVYYDFEDQIWGSYKFVSFDSQAPINENIFNLRRLDEQQP